MTSTMNSRYSLHLNIFLQHCLLWPIFMQRTIILGGLEGSWQVVLSWNLFPAKSTTGGSFLGQNIISPVQINSTTHFSISNYEFSWSRFLVCKLQMWCRFPAQFQPQSRQKVAGQTGTGLEGGNVRLDWAGKIIQLRVTKLLKWSCNHFYRSYTWPCLFLLQLRLLDATLEDLSTLFSVCLWIQFRN